MVDLTTNARERHIRFRDRHLVGGPGSAISHAEPTFHFVELVGPENVAEGHSEPRRSPFRCSRSPSTGTDTSTPETGRVFLDRPHHPLTVTWR